MKIIKKINIKEISMPGEYHDNKNEYHVSKSKIKGVKILTTTHNGLYVYRLTY